MRKSWILVLDSGNGGLWTLNEIKKLLPNENYIFFMDVLHSPYGNKSTKKLKKIAGNAVQNFLLRFNIKLVVLACNTLSSIAYDFLVQKFQNVPIVKIEPYLNSKKFKNQNTLVLATQNTLRHNQNIKKYRHSKSIFFKGFGNLAKQIDKNSKNLDVLQGYLNFHLRKYKKHNIKNVVLGCTHFNLIKQQICAALSKNVTFFENSKFVAKQVRLLLIKNHTLSKSKTLGTTLIVKK